MQCTHDCIIHCRLPIKCVTFVLPVCLQVLARKTRGQGLCQLFRLLLIRHGEGVQVARAANLELDRTHALLDLHGARVLAAGEEQELADVTDALRHFKI